MLYLFLLIWLFWFPYCAYVILKKPAARKFQLIRLAIWLSAAACIAGVHFIYHYSARHYADGVASKIEAYSASNGRYPSAISDVGITKEQLREYLGISYYQVDESGKPNLIYAVTFEPFSTFVYDFEKRSWKYLPG